MHAVGDCGGRGAAGRVSCDTLPSMSLRLHILLVRLSNNEHDVHDPSGRIGPARRVRPPVRSCARRPPCSRRGARFCLGQARSCRVPAPVVRALVRQLSYRESVNLARQACRMTTAREVEEFLLERLAISLAKIKIRV